MRPAPGDRRAGDRLDARRRSPGRPHRRPGDRSSSSATRPASAPWCATRTTSWRSSTPTGRLVYASPVTERILGLDIEPLIGTDVFDLIHPDDRDRARDAASDLTRDGAGRATGSSSGSATPTAAGASSRRSRTNLLDDPVGRGHRDQRARPHRPPARRGRAARGAGAVPQRVRARADRHGADLARRPAVPREPRARADPRARRAGAAARRRSLDLSHPDDREPCRESMRRLLAGATPSAQLEQRFVHHDGHPVWVSVSASLVRDVNDQPLYLVCQMEDITERQGERRGARAPGDPRPAHRAARTALLLRRAARARARRRRARPRARSRCCSSTSTASRWSTTASATPPATACSSRSPTGCSAAMGPTDIVARFGGDEFTVLCHERHRARRPSS